MSLSDLIRVNTHYTRSINMERDIESLSVVDAYIPTTRALRTLDTMVEAFKADESPRAWSLVGPYGSGKSSFAVFLTHLLSNPSGPATKAVIKKLRRVDAGIAKKYTALNKSTSGYCTVLLTGSPESLSKRLMESLAQTADEAWLNKRGRSPAIVEKLWLITERKELPSTSEILECIEELQDALARIGHNGLLIVIDELGKFLEYEARHYGANDIFLLQALAEHALARHETKLSLVVMISRGFLASISISANCWAPAAGSPAITWAQGHEFSKILSTTASLFAGRSVFTATNCKLKAGCWVADFANSAKAASWYENGSLSTSLFCLLDLGAGM